MCQAGQAALCIDSEQVVEIYWSLLSNSSTWFRLLLHFGWPLFLWGFGFSKVGVEKRLCVAPSWCWVMTAHSFVVVASPYTSAVQVYMADGHQLFFFSVPLYTSISPLLSSQHIFYLTYSLASVRKTIENILGNCAQREHRPHHQRALWCSSVVLYSYIQKGEIQRTSHKTTNKRCDFIYMNILPPLYQICKRN
jgi:hypothetical protein